MAIMKNRKDYRDLFKDYKDVVYLKQVAEMLSGINTKIIRKLLLKSFVIDGIYYIPKVWLIDYILSESYQEYKKILKHTIILLSARLLYIPSHYLC